MSAETLNIFPGDLSNEALIEDVFTKLVQVLATAGAKREAIEKALSQALRGCSDSENSMKVVSLGKLQRECMEVLCRWRRDPEFLDRSGEAAWLAVEGDGGSFAKLCEASGCSSDASVVLRMLCEFGAVFTDSNGRVHPTTPTFLVGRRNVETGAVALEAVLHQLLGFASVLHQNICGTDAATRPRFERSCTVVIAAELVPIFEQLVLRRGQDFVDSMDEWLERHKRDRSTSNAYSEVGVGAYFVDLGCKRD